MKERFDYIVVGGGSSGSVAAARLVNEGRRVLLLEGGYSHRHPLLDMPPGIFKMINGSKYMRYHTTEPQAHLDGRAHDIPQANVLGGGSSVNAQVYIRGRPSDYDEWDALLRGNNDGADWSWAAMLPHFRGMENNDRLCNERHGVDGAMLVSDPGHVDTLSRWFVQAIQATPGSIGYVEKGFAQQAGLKMAQIDSGGGAVELTDESTQKAVDTAKFKSEGNDLTLDLAALYASKEAGVYPLMLATYEIVCSKAKDPAKAAFTKAFLKHFASEETQTGLEEIGYAPLPDEVRSKVDAAIDALS